METDAPRLRRGARIRRWWLVALVGLLLLAPGIVLAGRFWDLPKALPPQQFGDLLLDRVSSANQVNSVYFSHWQHRVRYTCRVCHWELDFAFQAGQTEITEADNRNGLYCGACHNGQVAFGHDQANCDRCHTGQLRLNSEKFAELRARLPKNAFGNLINWAGAARSGRIAPVYSLYRPDEQPLDFRKRLELTAEWQFVPPALFPHDIHVRWLDCANCHPDIFNIKKKGTAHFLMQYILEERFCGVCHLRVAFPMDDCHRCHPGIKNQ